MTCEAVVLDGGHDPVLNLSTFAEMSRTAKNATEIVEAVVKHFRMFEDLDIGVDATVEPVVPELGV